MCGKNMSPKKSHNLVLEMPNLVRSSFFHILMTQSKYIFGHNRAFLGFLNSYKDNKNYIHDTMMCLNSLYVLM